MLNALSLDPVWKPEPISKDIPKFRSPHPNADQKVGSEVSLQVALTLKRPFNPEWSCKAVAASTKTIPPVAEKAVTPVTTVHAAAEETVTPVTTVHAAAEETVTPAVSPVTTVQAVAAKTVSPVTTAPTVTPVTTVQAVVVKTVTPVTTVQAVAVKIITPVPTVPAVVAKTVSPVTTVPVVVAKTVSPVTTVPAFSFVERAIMIDRERKALKLPPSKRAPSPEPRARPISPNPHPPTKSNRPRLGSDELANMLNFKAALPRYDAKVKVDAILRLYDEKAVKAVKTVP